ncbi:hypothetical protein MRX96_003715 [Rhipicephalus microplus]
MPPPSGRSAGRSAALDDERPRGTSKPPSPPLCMPFWPRVLLACSGALSGWTSLSLLLAANETDREFLSPHRLFGEEPPTNDLPPHVLPSFSCFGSAAAISEAPSGRMEQIGDKRRPFR